MLSVSKYKKLLGEEAEGLSEDEIRQLRDAQYQFAKFALERWLSEKTSLKTVQKHGIISPSST